MKKIKGYLAISFIFFALFPIKALADESQCSSMAAYAMGILCDVQYGNYTNTYIIPLGHVLGGYSDAQALLGGISGTIVIYDDPETSFDDVKIYYRASSLGYGLGDGCGGWSQTSSPPSCVQIMAVVASNCLPDADTYCILATACPDGQGLGFEYAKCQDDVPTGEGGACGHTDAMAAMNAGEIDGTINYPSCNCSYSYDEIQELCNSIRESPSCLEDDEECEGDQDCDGIPDESDMCPDTPRGAYVNDFGCPIDENDIPDSDGDGVPDDEDHCSGTPSGVAVDANGCPIPDGYNPEGDMDNDNELLEGVISWLKKISGIEEDLVSLTEDTNDLLNDTNDSLNDINDNLEGEIDDTLPDDPEFDPNMPDNWTPALTEDDLDPEGPSIVSPLYSIIDSATGDIKSFITGTSVNTSGSCSISDSISVLGQSVNIEFSVCDWDLSVWRTIMITITTFISFLYIWRP